MIKAEISFKDTVAKKECVFSFVGSVGVKNTIVALLNGYAGVEVEDITPYPKGEFNHYSIETWTE